MPFSGHISLFMPKRSICIFFPSFSSSLLFQQTFQVQIFIFDFFNFAVSSFEILSTLYPSTGYPYFTMVPPAFLLEFSRQLSHFTNGKLQVSENRRGHHGYNILYVHHLLVFCPTLKWNLLSQWVNYLCCCWILALFPFELIAGIDLN